MAPHLIPNGGGEGGRACSPGWWRRLLPTASPQLPRGHPQHPVPAVGVRFLQLSAHPAGERGASLLVLAVAPISGVLWGFLHLVPGGGGQQREWDPPTSAVLTLPPS